MFLLPSASTKVANARLHQTSVIPTVSRISRIFAHQPRLSIPLRWPRTNDIFLYRSRDCFNSRFLIFQVTIPRVSLLLLPSTPTVLFCRLRDHLATFELRRFSMNRLTCRSTVPTISHAIRSAKTRRWCPARDSGTSRSTSGVRSRDNITCRLIMTRLQPPCSCS